MDSIKTTVATRGKGKKAEPDRQALPHTPAEKAMLALRPSVNAAVVMQAYQGNVLGSDVDLNGMIEGLRHTFDEVKGGDLYQMEVMLVSQAKPRR